MPRRSSTNEDINQRALRIVRAAVEPTKSEAAALLGRLGGQKGGRARADKLTPERRREIAKKAAQARWQKKPATD